MTRRAQTEIVGLAALMATGVFWVVRATSPFGPGTEPDSATYLSAARGLSTGNGFVGAGGDPLTFFPPLFPTIVAAFHAVGLSYLSAIRFANAAAFGLLILVSVLWVRRLTGSAVTAGVAGLFVALSPRLVEMGSSGLSESVFSLTVALALALVIDVIRHRRRAELAIGLAVAAAFLTRYVGLALLPVAVGLIGLGRSKNSWRRRALVVAPVAIAAALWFARNLHVAGNLTGLRPRSSIGLATSLQQCLAAIGAWLLPANTATSTAAAVGGIVLVLLAASAIDPVFNAHRQGRPVEPEEQAVAWTAGFVLVYFFGIAVLAAQTAVDAPPRFLLPEFVPLVVLASVAVHRALQSITFATAHFARVGVAAITLLVMAVSLPRLADFVQGADREGLLTYSRRQWTTSPLMAYVRDNPIEGRVVTDDPYALSIYADVSGVLSPERTYYNSPQLTGSDGTIYRGPTGDEPTTLVWWFQSQLPHYFTLEELGQRNCLARVVHFEDGEIYRLC